MNTRRIHLPQPRIDIVLSVRDELPLIADKLDNLAAQNYPANLLRLIVVDGESSDGTFEYLVSRAADFPISMTVLRSDTPGKVPQMLAGINHCSTDWVLVTDADARLPVNALEHLVAEATRHKRVGVAAAYLDAVTPFGLERAYWHVSNAVQRAEQSSGGVGIAFGPCYLARRELVEQIPRDAGADDVAVGHIAALAHLEVRMANVHVHELRVATDLRSFISLRTRRGSHYFREVWRFLPRYTAMRGPGARAHRVRLFLIALLALGGAAAVALVGGLALQNWLLAAGLLFLGVGSIAVAVRTSVSVTLALPALAILMPLVVLCGIWRAARARQELDLSTTGAARSA